MKKLFFFICLSFFYLIFVVLADEGNYQSKNMQEATAMHSAAKVLSSLVGSAPPNCKGVCGRCEPRKAVLVRVPPSQEFYPLDWKCECGGVVYQPPNAPKPNLCFCLISILTHMIRPLKKKNYLDTYDHLYYLV
ncbi:hypothetical protein Pfo_013111 [Paulownia fortunei]|nr:hypothetical protein Pfo_013111 [Paulownia fortunei]